MPLTRTRVALVVIAGACLAGLGLVALSTGSLAPDAASVTGLDTSSAEHARRPLALARHLERLREALPGQAQPGSEGMAESPASAEDERFFARAYPDTDIPFERTLAARAAFDAINEGGIGQDKNAPGQWYHAGPASARYQATPYRTTYTPGEAAYSGRVTAMAIGPVCNPVQCRVWAAAAGGGVWRTDNALAGNPSWKFLTGGIGINAVGSIEVDPNDSSGNTVWVGTGEANASGDSAAGVGLYKSTDGGDTWTGPLGAAAFNGRSVGSIAIDPRNPNVIYSASTRGVRGVTSTGGGVSLTPGAAPWGLYKSTDGGATFTFLHNGTGAAAQCFPTTGAACSVRGVRRVALDPSNPDIVYAGSYGRGVWRSPDGGTTWTQIKPSLNASDSSMRPEIAVTRLPSGQTRMYVGEGSSGSPAARLYRTDDAAGAAPVFTDLTSNDPANPGYGSYNYCTGQCWYDNLVVTPAGYPDIVYVGGSYQYSGSAYRTSNGRALVLSTDGGVSWTDMTKDASSRYFPTGLHPDHHALVVSPNNPYLFFNGSDGGVFRSSGEFSDESVRCNGRGLTEPGLSRCRQLLSRVPTKVVSLNDGLATLQFYSLSVDPSNANNIQGGTQDNGTFESAGSPVIWRQTMWGDGGQSGFDAAVKTFRFHTYYNATPEVNFNNGRIGDWHWVADQIYYGGEPQLFYIPIISDPKVSRWMWAGLGHVWRTKTHGMGTSSMQAFSLRCNSVTGWFDDFCGDWEPLGATGYVAQPFPYLADPATYANTRLTASNSFYGTTKVGGAVSRVARASGDDATLWAGTSAGRVFISKNANAEPASAATFTRLDTTGHPGRHVSGLTVDPGNPNRAWVTFTGYTAATPTAPGHVFEVVFNPATGTAAWTPLDHNLGDLPLNDVAFDPVAGDLYTASDFGVMRLAAGSLSWALAGEGMPKVEVSSLTLVPGGRRLYAATHGLGAWWLTLR